MKLKISWLRIPSDLIPHESNESERDLEVVAEAIVDAYEESPLEEFEVDEKLLLFSSIFSSRIIGDLPSNLIYVYGRWGGKYFSGDISASLAESIVYSVLEGKFGVKLTDILPLRQVKFKGLITDTFINIEKYPKLKEFLGAEEGGLLLVNARSMLAYDRRLLARHIAKDLVTSENVRYPDNYSLLSYLIELSKLFMLVVYP